MQKKNLQTTLYLRPPVVAVLGHVDHGKTTLLDTIRKTNVTEKEEGGITQKIGAYQVRVQNSKSEVKGKLEQITFIDTPGHEAFAKMRSRGISVADIAILVVSASDGVMPQTKESIAFIKSAQIPMIVVMNKIDLPEAEPKKVIQQLAKEDVLTEDLGGDVVVVPVSAKTGKGIPELLDMILLISEMKEIKGDRTGELFGIVIEAELSKKKGNVATIIIKNGTLKLGETIYAENIKAKVKSMLNDQAVMIIEAGPGTPVEIMGWEKLPQIGSIISRDIKNLNKPEEKVADIYNFSLPDIVTTRKLNMILRADNAGSLEAIIGSLDKNVDLISSGTGEITEGDVLLAKSAKAIIIGFNLKPTNSVLKLAQIEEVRIKTFKIIYELLQEIADVLAILNHPQAQEETIGEGKIIAEFTFNNDRVAGCKVTSGRIARSDKIKIMRNDVETSRGRIKSMRVGKNDIGKVEAGKECGIVLDKKLDFALGDTIIAYKTFDLI